MADTLDSGVLQYIPKGAYYEGTDEQFARVKEMWDGLLSYDRVLFALLSMLNGSAFSKGMITHFLLCNPHQGKGLITKDNQNPLVPVGLDDHFETNIILFNLHKIADESMPRALKNLLILAGSDANARRVNNSRTRKIIMEFIFNRDNRELDALAVNYKTKLAKLVRHALGKQDLYNILNSNNEKLFMKLIGRYNRNALPIVCFLFGVDPPLKATKPYFPRVADYLDMRLAAASGDMDLFKKAMQKLPWRTVIGFRNTYKLPIDKADIMGKAKMSDKDKMQTQTAQKRAGAKTVRKVNYEKQDLLDLWKLFYHKILNNDSDEMVKITAAIDKIDNEFEKIDFGSTAVIVDMSHSMRGSDQRPLHPMLTSMCLLSTIKSDSIHFVSGKWVEIPDTIFSGVVASGSSPLWKGLVDAVQTGSKTIVIISDGYENAIKGMFAHVYKHFKDSGKEFDLIHINPVFSADAKTGTTRALVDDVSPIPVASYKSLETEFIFRKMLDHTELVKDLLVARYQKLIGGK